jgi:hypothetical protein
MTKPCAVIFDQRKKEYCKRDATTFAREDGHIVFYCAEHGREHGAKDIDPTTEARARAEVRAHDRVSPGDSYDAIGAVNLYVEAFIAGARFAEARRGQTA